MLVRRCWSASAALAVAVAALASAPVRAEEARVTVFPPLYREIARETRAIAPRAELTTTPQPVPAAPRKAEAAERVAQVR
ncbi:hypothetical protein [Methylobacterium nodulans]|uniref:Uncharacterized protein n=1 Tax=Methylobacterium nodulans (strain LMG 21967 / CNCM I-2342 / ORS 2060) TaxID=460265 RepID=B8ILA9_METNO|nr:hypothetical protein [Methylobacterium nodulans]ACL60108.1 conserved hypothetical protein [Methylobacterium nodulans ORS 2060]